MRILLLHPDDAPFAGCWADQAWDRVIDLGFAGEGNYRDWSAHFGCPVKALPSLDLCDMQLVRESIFSALGRLVDSEGLDWWELIGIRFHEPLERIVALRKATLAFNARDELFFSRPCFHARVAEILCRCSIRCFSGGNSFLQTLHHLSSAPFKLGFAQIIQVAGDKYDAGYRLRRLTAPRAQTTGNPVTLLPSAYGNGSRTALAYAASLPDHDFLLVTTRRSGRLSQYPQNVRVADLASYAPGKANHDELDVLLSSWNAVRREIAADRDLAILSETGLLYSVPQFLREGLAIRDAWLRVFDLEPVRSVLCTDDSNPYTRIPLLIAAHRNLPAIACHHGALDGRYLIKKCHREITLLAKGEMERDYLVARCGIPEEQVEVGAPAVARRNPPRVAKNSILYFSEPYELSGGRCEEVYREVLPKLSEVAAQSGRKLVLKLHPYESRRERRALARSVLPEAQFRRLRIVDGPLADELLNDAWFAVTILSTTAVDSALCGIPVFLCRWLDHTNYRYGEQFVKFGVGAELNCASDIYQIPRRLEKFTPDETRYRWQPISPERFKDLITNAQLSRLAAAV